LWYDFILQGVSVHSFARIHFYTGNYHFERKMQILMPPYGKNLGEYSLVINAFVVMCRYIAVSLRKIRY